MKHLFLTLLGLLSLLTLRAQSPYYPMLNDSNIWQVHGTVRLGGQGEIIHGCEGYYTLEGDTLFKGQLYKRIYSLGKGVLYFFREDTVAQKIYIINRLGNVTVKHKGDTVEQVYFDFNMQAGDSMRSIGYRYDSIPYWIKVVNLDSILFTDGTWHQRYELSISGGGWGYIGYSLGATRYVIEGIGSLHGIDDFYSINPYGPSSPDASSIELIALWRYGVQLWSIGYDCSAFGIKEEAFNKPEINIYPNPFQDKIEINFGESTTQAIGYKLINLIGEVIIQEAYTSAQKEIIIYTKLISAGVYFIDIELENGTHVTRKISSY